MPCCDMFHLNDGAVTSVYFYKAASILLEQLGVLGNLEAALKN
ncbi:hypothetical protein NOVOSPHI9U_310051 [Novosphingobium sp. 9U]|nr:hypothetical protein NOVOSPHI9U_310051 [Novosphingobium sp. 9U]